MHKKLLVCPYREISADNKYLKKKYLVASFLKALHKPDLKFVCRI